MSVREGEETQDRLEPCPCGDERPVETYAYFGPKKSYRVECREPGCWMGPKADSPLKARRLWNARG